MESDVPYPVPKRVLDKGVAVVLGVLLAPVFAVALAAMGLDMLRVRRDRGPWLYRERRVSRGREFDLLKFRTLRRDVLASREGEAHARLLEADTANLTWAGRRVLKPWYLDELPQLLNVLRGDMSLVGPRPPLPVEVIDYDIWHRRRLSMKPGITGLWQVTARNNPDFDRWVERDLEYIDRWSLWLDVTILARTLPSVVTQQGR
jgi:lipopolysaccharide/colanic/teichoic acid biosynthesis glycosyltransferase